MEDKELSFLDHLEELRWVIIYSIIAVMICAIGCYFISSKIIDILTKPVGELVFLGPTEAFVTRLKISGVSGLVVASPFIFYQIWRFISPGLFKTERRYVLWGVLSSTIFFLTGIAFAHFVVLPVGLRFLLGFATETLQPMISIDRYTTFIVQIFLAFGIIFQLPVACFFLTKIGVLEPEALKRNRRVAIVIVMVVSAVLTPPDVFTQLLMAIPLLALFEISIWLSVIAARPGRSQ